MIYEQNFLNIKYSIKEWEGQISPAGKFNVYGLK